MKRNHSSGSKTCTCSKCNMEAHSIAGKTHRRCPGQPDQPLKAHGNYIAAAERGKWK